ncbi:MAG TPA: DinB family protein [Bryobacteraceae bacterium]|jgi:hypothetical protein|nr:DinB family protein [Bryobacteraceae bacterium]
METLESAIEEFRGILAGVPAELSLISDAHAGAPRAPEPSSTDKWSRKQILGHLLDSAANNHHRFVRAQIEGKLTMPSYAQQDWVAIQDYRNRPWNELIEFWNFYNRHLLHLMEEIPGPNRNNPCQIGDGGAVTLEFLAIDYVRHLKHHLHQVLAK